MRHDWEERDDDVAEGATCPIQGCGVLVVAYRPPDFTGRDNADPCEFTCPRCGIVFYSIERRFDFSVDTHGPAFCEGSRLIVRRKEAPDSEHQCMNNVEEKASMS